MSVLNDKLEKIISDSGLYFYQDEIEKELKVTEDALIDIDLTIQTIWRKLPDDTNIAIFGLGGEYAYLFRSIDLTMKNVVCMIDNNTEIHTFKGYRVIRSKDIPQNNIDIVIITSRAYAEEMELSIKDFLPKSKIIHFWKEIYLYGYPYNERINYPIGKEKFVKAIALYRAIQSYKKTKDIRYLLYIIYSYLMFRDLRNAFVYIDKYISLDYGSANKMIRLKNSLIHLLDEIRQNLASKQNKHCLIVLADSMKAEDIAYELTPFLFHLAQNNIQCTNAFTHMGWTSTSLLTIFKQKSFFDNHLYSNVKFTGNEWFFKYLFNNKIEFYYYWPLVKWIFADIPELTIKSCQNGCADIVWQYLCDAFENDVKSVFFLHFMESHTPYLCLPHDNMSGFANEDCSGCIKYIDSQMEFLFSLLPKETKILFCSDHGHVRSDSKSKMPLRYNNDYCNIPYIICDKLTHGIEKRIVSHLDTINVVLNLINDRPAFNGVEYRDFAEINEEFFYAKSIMENIVNNHTISDHKKGEAFKCFVTEKDKYVVFHDGEERYFLLPDDDTNLIGDPQYADRINWFRANVNTEFPDWSDDNGRYDIARKYYKL